MLAYMHDIFTTEDRAAMNASLAGLAATQYQEQRAQHPRTAAWRVLVWVLVMQVPVLFVWLLVSMPTPSLRPYEYPVFFVLGLVGAYLVAQQWHFLVLRNAARNNVIAAYAASRGWSRVNKLPVAVTTPLLRHPRGKMGWGVQGVLDDQTRFTVGAYEYTEGGGDSRETYPFTVAMIDAPLSGIDMVMLNAVERRKVRAMLKGTTGAMRQVALESVEFDKAFELLIAANSDPLVVQRRFSPVVQVAMIDRGLGRSLFEAENGVLVAATFGLTRTKDFGQLLDVLGDALWMRSVLVDEPAGRVPDLAELRAKLLGTEATPAA